MGVTTSQQISKYYDLFGKIDVAFTKEVIKATNLVSQLCYLKCMGEQWPCVIFSTSFVGARVLVPAKAEFHDNLNKANKDVSLRICFNIHDKADPRAFFVHARVSGYSAYAQNPALQSLQLAFSQRPPDDLIEIMGRLLEANMNSAKRREERVLVTSDAMRKIGIASKETILFIQGVPRRCILRDLSFSGAKGIMVGVSKFLINKQITLRSSFDDPRETLDFKGTSVRGEDVEGRKDLVALALHFDEAAIPMSYKMRLNDYLTQVRKTDQISNEPEGQ